MKYPFIVFYFCLINTFSYAQEVQGYVKNSKNEPIAFANIICLNASDSTFITGNVSDSTGFFRIKNKISNKIIIKIKVMGYKEYIKELLINKTTDLGIVILSEDSKLLKEVKISKNREMYNITKQGINANVIDSYLTHSGFVTDVLNQLPFVSVTNSKINVFSRGEPDIYINNRKVQDKEELRQIKASMIKNVEIILNPGAEFGNETQSVIKITTRTDLKNGIFGYLYTNNSLRSSLSNYESVLLNYNNNGLNLFLYGNFDDSKRKEQQYDFTSISPFVSTIRIYDTGTVNYSNKKYSISPGFNYAFNNNHTIGAKYSFNNIYYSPTDINFRMSPFREQSKLDDFNMQQNASESSYKHYLNIFYEGIISTETRFKIYIDYIKGNNNRNDITDIYYSKSGKNEDVSSNSNTTYRLFAGKITGETRILKGNASFGAELYKTYNIQTYLVDESNYNNILSSTKSRSNQLAKAIFADWGKTWKYLNISMGVRYERTDFSFFQNSIKQKQQSKIYNELFPSFSIGYKKDKLGISASFKNKISRPSYNYLRNTISFNSPYQLESGNPFLLPAKSKNLNLLLIYKQLKASLDYIITDNSIQTSASLYNQQEILIFKPINLDKTFYGINFSYSPTLFKIWHPTFEFGIGYQKLKAFGFDYNGWNYSYNCQNSITFSKNFIIQLNVVGQLHNRVGLSERYPSWNTDLNVSKTIQDGKWEFSFGFSDIFNTSRTKWIIRSQGIKLKKNNYGDTQGAYLSITLNFKTIKKTYKGKAVNQNEINRL